jgi:hypothetical protein
MRAFRLAMTAVALAAALGSAPTFAADVSDLCVSQPGGAVIRCVVSPTTGECRCPEDPALPQSVSN